MSPEQAIVENLLAEMEKNVNLLQGLVGVSKAEFTSDPQRYLFAERCFQLAIECLVDVCYPSIVHSKLADLEDFRVFQRHALTYLTRREKGKS